MAINNEVGIFFLFFVKLAKRYIYYFINLPFYRSPCQPVTSLPLLVSNEKRTRQRHTGDVLLCYWVCLSFVLVWLSEEQGLLAFPPILPSSNLAK